ncbi:hypothetical protein ECEC1870_1258, partial [Escherichia coli EC1870]
MWPVPLLHGFS